MVDCASPRCVQDRRLLKKELLSWTKKVPILIGLEQIAEAYAGKHVFQAIMEPFQGLESATVEDWEPNSECHYCLSTNTSEKNSPESDPDPEINNITDTDGVDFYQHYLPLGYPSSYLLDGSTLDNSKPLDLSASSRYGDHSDHDDTSHPLVELKVPQITNKISKKKDLSGKRSYTEEDLGAAVRDIQSGKLGTRRAAALYGIPRSTLRNKIFRIESENACERQCVGNLSMADLLQNMASNGDAAKNDWTQDDWEHKLDQLRRKHDLNAGMERPFGMPPLFFNSRNLMDCEKAFGASSPFDYEARMPFLQELVRKFAEHRMEAERAQCLGLPFMSDLNGGSSTAGMGLTAGLVDLKIPSYKPMRSYMNGSASNGMIDLAASSKNMSSDTEHSGAPTASNKINDTLKDIIAKTIAEKVRSRTQPLEGDVPMTNPLTNGYLKQELDNPSDLPSPHQTKRFKREHKSSDKLAQHESNLEINNQQLQKKTRPKRGQYRKYNSQLLLEAVRAVQRGEMSVHRAGSYFGVPHSTLEYKVKERHLMRQKKPREPRVKKASSNVTTATTTSTTGLNIPTPGGSFKLEDRDGNSDAMRHELTPSPATSITETSSQDSSSCQGSIKMATTPVHDTPRPDPDMIAHSINSLLSAQAAGLPLPGGHPFSNFYMAGALPLGFGWPPTPLMNGGLPPLPLPDPAMAACFPGFGVAPGVNLSASDLLKKLQQKVQANAPVETPSRSSGSSRDASQSLQGSKSGSSQVIVK